MIPKLIIKTLSVIEYILGSLFRLAFIFGIFLFHPIQVIAQLLFGNKAQQLIIQLMNGYLLLAFRLAGTKSSVIHSYKPPLDQPIIFIANHQSLWDIVGIYWYLRAYNPIFVSKLELSKGIPSISYNLRKSGAALIDRKDKTQALEEIKRLGIIIHDERRAAVIFPEGTRSKTGQLRKFSFAGIATLRANAPSALLVPIAIRGTRQLEANKYYRIKAFKEISWTILPPIDVEQQLTEKQVADHARAVILHELES